MRLLVLEYNWFIKAYIFGPHVNIGLFPKGLAIIKTRPKDK